MSKNQYSKSKPINVKYLRDCGACSDGIDRFMEVFGHGDVAVTLENCLKVNSDYLRWYARKTFTRYNHWRLEKRWKEIWTTCHSVNDFASGKFKAEVAKAFLKSFCKNEKDQQSPAR